MLVRIANRVDPDQTASSEAVYSGSALFVQALLAGNYSSIQNFRTFTVIRNFRNAYVQNGLLC